MHTLQRDLVGDSTDIPAACARRASVPVLEDFLVALELRPRSPREVGWNRCSATCVDSGQSCGIVREECHSAPTQEQQR